MTDNSDIPSIESRFPDMMDFVITLSQDLQSGEINSWPAMQEKVKAFFSLDELDRVNALAPGWRRMASYADGITLVHVMSVFTALFQCPEFQQASRAQQESLKWIVFFHDLGKEIRPGQRDFTHAFQSAVGAGKTLPGLGFVVTPDYAGHIDNWVSLVNAAVTRQDKTSTCVQDNRKLAEIIDGIEQLFGRNSPAALIVKTVLLHMSIDVVEDWPQAVPLSEVEIKAYVDRDLIPLLKVMLLVDNDSWALFDLPTKERYRYETLGAFRKLESLVAFGK
jgi:hypothetical protein